MVVVVQGKQVGPHLDLRMLPYLLTGYVKVMWRSVHIFLVFLQEFSVYVEWNFLSRMLGAISY